VGRPEFIPTRKSLLERLRNVDDSDSWRAFYQTYWRLIYATAINAGLTDFGAQDVVQETLIAVSKSMPGFKYDGANGSFKAWLLKLTTWRISDQLRIRRRRENGLGHSSPSVEPKNEVELMIAPDLEAQWDEEWERNLFDAAIQLVKFKANHKEYQIFDLAVVQKWPVPKISTVLNVAPARVYRCKHRVFTLLKLEIQQLKSKYL